MAKIDVTTTQNVTIQYDTAGLIWRFVAWLIDSVILTILYLIIVYAFFSSISIFDDELYFLIVSIILILIRTTYSLFIEIFTNGQSIGKKIVGISVIKLNGNALNTNDYLIRWAYRIIDFSFSFFTVGTLSILISEKNQRLGDMIASTTVVKLKPEKIVTLEDLENLPIKDEYIPKYPNVVRYTDNDMLALKNLLVRYNQYRNNTYSDMLSKTVEQIKQQLEIENITVSDDIFLRELISEYVILTR